MSKIIRGKEKNWQVVIGLEIHAQVQSNSKLFSDSPTTFGEDQNTQVSLVDAAMPGMLPVLNGYCVEQAVRTGLGLNAEVNLFSIFDRKNYFYQDLPQGYQISQFKYPIIGNGSITISTDDGNDHIIGLERIHLEQDAGKSIHDQSPSETFVDLNRAGIALMEIVTKPDMRSSEEAASFIKKLRSILRYLNTCDGNMEQGSLRCDANVSVMEEGGDQFGTRVEIKNLNSVKHIIKAIDFEANRHVAILEGGGEIQQSTRLFDVNAGETKLMRLKEDVRDYRYFSDPDLLPLELTEEYVESIRKTLPELPDAKHDRYVNDLRLSSYDASVIVADRNIAEYFEQLVESLNLKSDAKLAANWLTSELFAKLNQTEIDIGNSPVVAQDMAHLLNMVSSNIISGKIAKNVFDIMFKTGKAADTIVQEQGLQQISDTTELAVIIDDIVAANPDKLQQYRDGKHKLLGFFVGQVMQQTKGAANPQIVNELLLKRLSK